MTKVFGHIDVPNTRGGLGRLHGATVVALVLLLALAAILASTLLPDPTWMGGLFDGADEDGLLALFWDHGSPPALEGLRDRPILHPSPLAMLNPSPARRSPRRSFASRAPPAV